MNLHRRPGRLVAISTALLLATSLGGCGSETDTPVADVSDSPSPLPTASLSSTPGGSPLTVAGLETGPAPKIGYAVGGRLVLPDGGGFALPNGTFDVARLGELTVVMGWGRSDGQLAFLDPDGRLVQAWAHGDGTVVGRPQWEDSKHVLAVVFEDETWSIVRCGVDGSMEYAVPPQPGQDVENPYLLQTT